MTNYLVKLSGRRSTAATDESGTATVLVPAFTRQGAREKIAALTEVPVRLGRRDTVFDDFRIVNVRRASAA